MITVTTVWGSDRTAAHTGREREGEKKLAPGSQNNPEPLEVKRKERYTNEMLHQLVTIILIHIMPCILRHTDRQE